MTNVELLEKVLTHIKDHPGQHNQRTWGTRGECGTTYCFAGWACMMSGLDLKWSSSAWRQDRVVGVRGSAPGVFDVAQSLLGLTQSQAEVLFLDAETLSEVEDVVKDLLNGVSP